MWPFAKKAKADPEITFRDLLLRFGLVPGKLLTFTDEEQQAVDAGWAQFTKAANAGAPPGQRLYVPPEVLRAMEEANTVSSLDSLALELVTGRGDSSARESGLRAAAKSLVLSATPLHFYNVAHIFERAEELAAAACLYREFLRRNERQGQQEGDGLSQIEEGAVRHAEEWLATTGPSARRMP